MAVTQSDYTGNGSTVLYTIGFPYIEETDVKVSLNGVVTTAYTFPTATQIQFTSAPAAGVAIRIYRRTNNDELSAEFYSGSAIRAVDLNNNFTQNLYVNQEVVNNSVSTDGSTPMTGNLNMNGYKVTNLATPTAGTDATTKAYVDAADVLKVAKSGDTMTGPLGMSFQKITTLGEPFWPSDAATRGYVDTNDALQVSRAGDSMSGDLDMGGNKIFNIDAPSADTDPATKLYVDTKVGASGPPGYTNWSFIATGGETVLGETGSTLEYQPGKEQLYLNGALQRREVDYAATDGRTVTITPALIAGDVVMVRCVNYLAADPTASYDLSRWVYTAVGGETALSGGSPSLSYTVNREQVFLNGALLQRGIDYTANNGSSISILGPALISGDMVEVHSNNSI